VTTAAIEFRVLGPLEALCDGREIALGGAKQRAVLAVLLLRAGEVVPVERLVDEVWGDDPPPSAAHTLESYISRLRQLFNGHGPLLVRRGAGYALELGDALLDARRFVELQERASLAAAMDDHADVVELTAAALAMWRGPALADVALASAGRAEADRLEELRLRTYELRFDAELALGREERAIGELQSLVAQNLYRERFVAQLMLALYRSGRHAEALEAYEHTRRRLDDDLGLQPSTDLRQLSGQIVRQDTLLQRPAPSLPQPSLSLAVGRRTRRVGEFAVVGAIVAAVMALTASGSAPQLPNPAAPASEAREGALVSSDAARITLLVPKRSPDRVLASMALKSLRSAESTWEFEGDVVEVDEVDADAVEGLVDRIEAGSFANVLVLGDRLASSIAPVVRGTEATTFAFVDASLADLGLEGVANASAVRFAEEHSSQLMGYLSAIVRTRRAPGRVETVSVVAGPPSPRQERVIAGFEQGVEHARPGISVLVGHVEDPSDPTECERLANEQIDRGSDVVLVDDGSCGLGAVAVARMRGVWAIGAEGFVSAGPHVLATTYKNYDQAVYVAISDLLLGPLERGEDFVLGLDDEYAVGVEHLSPVVPERLWSRVVLQCSKIRQQVQASES
jgi:DNA-binding SARP family transcriptional activator/basic membrane lipoprotein Med (substrate-binding protein (PBP1-ABC) superfamily)